MEDLPTIDECKGSIITCRFKADPDYSSIIMHFYICFGIFIIIPFLIRKINLILFEKIFCKKTLNQLFCNLKITLRKRKRKRVKVSFGQASNMKRKQSFWDHMAYRRVVNDTTPRTSKIELSKLNQVAPIRNVLAEEDDRMITEGNEGRVMDPRTGKYISKRKLHKSEKILNNKLGDNNSDEEIEKPRYLNRKSMTMGRSKLNASRMRLNQPEVSKKQVFERRAIRLKSMKGVLVFGNRSNNTSSRKKLFNADSKSRKKGGILSRKTFGFKNKF